MQAPHEEAAAAAIAPPAEHERPQGAHESEALIHGEMGQDISMGDISSYLAQAQQVTKAVGQADPQAAQTAAAIAASLGALGQLAQDFSANGDMGCDIGSEYSVSEHMQMYPHGQDEPMPHNWYRDSELESLADGDMPNYYRAFPGQTGFGWDWPWRRRRHRGAVGAPGLVPGMPGYVAPPYDPRRRGYGPRGRYIAGADPATQATNAAALQAAGAAAAIGSTVLGHDSQKRALKVIMSHAHLRLGALSTGIGSVWHKIVGIFDHVANPTLEKASIAPDGKGGLVTAMPKGAA